MGGQAGTGRMAILSAPRSTGRNEAGKSQISASDSPLAASAGQRNPAHWALDRSRHPLKLGERFPGTSALGFAKLPKENELSFSRYTVRNYWLFFHYRPAEI